MTKTLLITGANRGIGLEMTRQVVVRGDNVIACTRNAPESPDLVALAKQYDSITVLGLDVCAETDTKHIAAGMKRPIDILVCNAGALNSYGACKRRTMILPDRQCINDKYCRRVLPHGHFCRISWKGRPGRSPLFHQKWAVRNWPIAMRRFTAHQKPPRQIWRGPWLLSWHHKALRLAPFIRVGCAPTWADLKPAHRPR